MNSNVFLITRPNHDFTTNYLYHWSSLVIKEAKSRSFSVCDLSKKRANQKELTNVIKKTKPDFIFFNGHGNENSVTGFDNQVLVEAGKNENILTEKIVYALSCQSAKRLGRMSIKKGTKSYLGYDDDFVFMFNEKNISHPLSDKTAKVFLEPSNLLAISILKGNQTRDAHQKSQQAYRKNIKKILNSDFPQEDKSVLPYLLWNMKHQVCLGNQKAKLS